MLVRHRRRRRRRHHRRRHSSSPALSPPSTSHHPCPRRPCPRRLRYLHNSAGTIPPPSPPVAIAWACTTSCGRGSKAARCHAVDPACAGCAQLSMDACLGAAIAGCCACTLQQGGSGRRSTGRANAFDVPHRLRWFAFPAGGASDGTRLSRLVLPCLSTGSGIMQPSCAPAQLGADLGASFFVLRNIFIYNYPTHTRSYRRISRRERDGRFRFIDYIRTTRVRKKRQ